MNKCVFDLGKFSSCRCITLPFTVEETGIYKLVFEWRGKIFTIQTFNEAGKKLTFYNKLNEISTIEFYVIKPDNSKLVLSLFNGSSIESSYNKYRLTVSPTIEISEELILSPELIPGENNFLITKTL